MIASTKLRRSRSSLSREVGDEIYLASPHREGYDRLEGTAASIWRCLESDATAGEILQSLAARYGVAGESIEAETFTFLRELERRGWITSVRP